MKKMVGLLLKITFLGCTKEDDTPKKFDLNGTFVATVAGWSQPLPINDLATWVATYIDDRITANITYYLGSPGRAKYKGKIVNDTTLIGGFIDIPATSIVNEKISKDGNRITCATATSNSTY